MENKLVDRRRHERVQLSLPIQGKCLYRPFKSHPFKGITRDLSFDGVCIEIPQGNGFRPGQRLTFKTQLYEGNFTVKGKGMLCWVDLPKEQDRSIRIGVKLMHMRHYGTWCERIENKLVPEQD